MEMVNSHSLRRLLTALARKRCPIALVCNFKNVLLARRPRAKFWPDCAIPDTSMKFGTVVDHD